MKDLYFYQVTIFHKRTKPFKNFFSLDKVSPEIIEPIQKTPSIKPSVTK